MLLYELDLFLSTKIFFGNTLKLYYSFMVVDIFFLKKCDSTVTPMSLHKNVLIRIYNYIVYYIKLKI